MNKKIAKIEQFLQTLENEVLSDQTQSIILSTAESVIDGTGSNEGCTNSVVSSCNGTNTGCGNYLNSCGDSTNKTNCINTEKSQRGYNNYMTGCPDTNYGITCELHQGNAVC